MKAPRVYISIYTYSSISASSIRRIFIFMRISNYISDSLSIFLSTITYTDPCWNPYTHTHTPSHTHSATHTHTHTHTHTQTPHHIYIYIYIYTIAENFFRYPLWVRWATYIDLLVWFTSNENYIAFFFLLISYMSNRNTEMLSLSCFSCFFFSKFRIDLTTYNRLQYTSFKNQHSCLKTKEENLNQQINLLLRHPA